MPVPVPRLTKPVAHPVIKQNKGGDGPTNPFQNLTRTLPVSPTGPPPSFGTREEWINSLPSWRRTKPRRIWEDDLRLVQQRAEQNFYGGLTVADNASVIKGEHAEACIPPLYTLFEAPALPPVGASLDHQPQGCDTDADDEMSSDYSPMEQACVDSQSQWSAASSAGDDVDRMAVDRQLTFDVPAPSDIDGYDDDQMFERGAFTPVYEDELPGMASGQDAGSSPIGPVTPFGDFVDRVVATEPYVACDEGYAHSDHIQEYVYQEKRCTSQCAQSELVYQTIPEQTKEPVPVLEVVTPSATTGYKKLAEPLSEWVANYVWKVCTLGLSLPSMFAQSSHAVTRYASNPPSYLANAVHSLLLSTLLQPSAVFLAIWYIVRLPVFFDAVDLARDQVEEIRFRTALLGDGQYGEDQQEMEASAPFRLIVLGCMLANKWLDDHTFSNKTWHTISNVPVHTLNKLESLALAIFSHDLSVSTHNWSQWLSHVMSYHMSLASPSYPQPISRPSTNPHSIVRKAIDEIIQAPKACNFDPANPQPVFLGLEDRKREKLEKEQALTVDVLDINLDEDGPLREEYLPKRHISAASTTRVAESRENQVPPQILADNGNQWRRGAVESNKHLPPPAKWSPAGDEPILRDRNRVSGQYVAVQPPLPGSAAPYHSFYQQPHDGAYAMTSWHAPGGYLAVKQPAHSGYGYDLPPIHTITAPVYHLYPSYVPQIAMSHSRSQSLSYDQDNSQSRNHMRSHSQTRFEYRYSDIRMTANELAPPPEFDFQWGAGASCVYPAPTFGPHAGVNHQSAWLRT